MNKEIIREQLAIYAHKTWSSWMDYLFSRSIKNDDGTITIPEWAVRRWKRQCITKYEDLSEEEKESDLDEADKIISIMEEDNGKKKNY